MKPDHALNILVGQLDKVEIPHMITGSFASTYHGMSRTTLDVDVVIDPSPGNFSLFLAYLAQNGFYVSEANAKAALLTRSQFNVVHIESVWKFDLIIRKNRPFNEIEFARREAVNIYILGVDTFVVSAEDIILAKLEWAKDSASERQLKDIEGIIEINAGQLDRAYLEKWAERLSISDSLSQLSWPG